VSDPTPIEAQDNARSLRDPNRRYPQGHQVIKNYALEVCQLLFSGENPFDLHWDANQEKSTITIVDKYSFNLDQVGASPAIVANRGPMAWMKTSGFRQLQSLDPKTGVRTYTDLARGGVTLSCFSRSGEEAENIGGFVFEAFQILRDVLRKSGNQGRMVPNHLGFFRIEAMTLGEEALVKSGSRPSLSVVPVAISAMVQRRWAVSSRSAPKLQGIDVRTSRGT
jgi:hypothetical protein